MEKEALEELKAHISVIRGLINYHKRMVAPLDPTCNKDGECPVLAFENDLYLGALQTALTLMEREVTFKDGILESPGWWETIRRRIVEYDKNIPYYPDDYKERLIKVDTAAIDSVISVLKSLE